MKLIMKKRKRMKKKERKSERWEDIGGTTREKQNKKELQETDSKKREHEKRS